MAGIPSALPPKVPTVRADAATKGRCGYDVMGLPTSNESSGGKDGVYQTFDRGWMEWNPRDDVRIHLGARPPTGA